MVDGFKRPVLAACPVCKHVWPCAWIPMEVSVAMKAMQANSRLCPACGDIESEPTMANQAQEIAWSNRHASMKTEVRE